MSRSEVDFIAEVSSNHYADLDRCLRFIDTAATIGCAMVKFQLFKVEQLFAPEILARSRQHRRRGDWELPTGFLPELAGHCRQAGISFSCTPFYLKAVEELYPHVSCYKVASYELLWHDLLAACAQTGKPVILSTGMATLEEIDAAVEVLTREGCQRLTLLHCVSGYPAPPQQCNLAAIETLRQRFQVPVGWSDHSVSPAVLYRAIHRYGAETVEFHLDLDGRGEEFGAGHCWLPRQIEEVIATVRTGCDADGSSTKEPVPAEQGDREWRADPEDGLRPLRSVRHRFQGDA